MKRLAHFVPFLALVACAPSSGFVGELPDEVLALAASGQNLRAVKLEEDECYWYQHDGPVETTLLPLRSKRGQHICVGQSGTS